MRQIERKVEVVPVVGRRTEASPEAGRKTGCQPRGHLWKSFAGRGNCKIKGTEVAHSWKGTEKRSH